MQAADALKNWLDELFRTHNESMMGLAVVMAQDHDAADEVVGKVWARISAKPSPALLDATSTEQLQYLLAAVRNEVYFRSREQKSKSRKSESMTDEIEEGLTAPPDVHPSDVPAPHWSSPKKIPRRQRVRMIRALEAHPDLVKGGPELLARLKAMTPPKRAKDSMEIFVAAMTAADLPYIESSALAAPAAVFANHRRTVRSSPTFNDRFEHDPMPVMAALRRVEVALEGGEFSPGLWCGLFVHAVAFMVGRCRAAGVRRTLYEHLIARGVAQSDIARAFGTTRANVCRALSSIPPADGPAHRGDDVACAAMRSAARGLPSALQAQILLALSAPTK